MLLNTYFDYANGVDGQKSSDQTLVKRIVSPQAVFRTAVACVAVAGAILALTLAQRPGRRGALAALFGAGAAIAASYTGGPSFKYRALGDVCIILAFGPLLVAFSYCMQAGFVHAGDLLYSVPTTVHIEAILHGNNVRDYEEDRRTGVRTLAGCMGPRFGPVVYALLLGIPYLMAGGLAVFHGVVWLLPVLTAPLAWRLARDALAGVLVDLPARTARVQFLFSLLYTASLSLAAGSTGAPPLADLREP